MVSGFRLLDHGEGHVVYKAAGLAQLEELSKTMCHSLAG